MKDGGLIERATKLQSSVNARLAALFPLAAVDPILEEMLGEHWQYADATTLDGQRAIVITGYTTEGKRPGEV